jgi:hypothetical protein
METTNIITRAWNRQKYFSLDIYDFEKTKIQPAITLTENKNPQEYTSIRMENAKICPPILISSHSIIKPLILGPIRVLKMRSEIESPPSETARAVLDFFIKIIIYINFCSLLRASH